MRVRFFLGFLFSTMMVNPGLIGQTNLIYYEASDADFPNPERGFYEYSSTYSGNYVPLDTTELKSWRQLHQPWGANFSIYSTLVFRYFFLESFKSGPIDQAYLDAMNQDFAAARQSGVKLIVRFAYTEDPQAGGCMFCPPYGDAPKTIVLMHIGQLKPLLQANADVIVVLQMGFVGIWGEGYYTDYFGDASQPPYGLTAQNWIDRQEIADSLLSALPSSRCLQVRYAQMKQKFVYGADAPLNALALTENEAWQNTAKARIGFHNDCFLASPDDYGTFADYDIDGVGSDTAILKPYWAQDAQFVPVGGETCDDWDPYSNCSSYPGGGADIEMDRLHYSYLNATYNHDVLNDWATDGCMKEIKRRLGYRLVLQEGEYTSSIQPGQTMYVRIELKNTGYAAPFNPRKVRLLLRSTSDGVIYHVDLPDDPRQWLPGEQIWVIEQNICIPPSLPFGEYELLLHLADPYPTLNDRPEYAIRFANGGNVWESGTGYNRLLHTLTVNSTASGLACEGGLSFSPGTVSTHEPESGEAPWGVYPNPTSSTIYVITPLSLKDGLEYHFYDSVGQIVESGQSQLFEQNLRINLPSNSSGLLFLVLHLPNGQNKTFRVVHLN